jgi:ABC-type multidrug transport system permease subunit
MRRLMLAAPNRSGIVLGYTFSALIRWATVISVVTVVALLARMKIGGDGVDLFGLYALGLFVNLAGTMWATGVAMRLRTQQAAPVMQMPVFLILFFAPVYVPLDLLQGWIHGVAAVNPITALLEAGRGLISGRPERTLAAFAIVVGLIAGFSLWAVRGLRRAEAAG